MPDPAAEMFHSELSRLLEPLALVYLRLRDLRHSANGHADVVSAAQERLNMKALVLAQQLAEISAVVDLSAAKNRDFASVEQAAQDEAEVLSRVCVFIEQDHQSESARLHEPVAIPLQTASYHQLQFTEPC